MFTRWYQRGTGVVPIATCRKKQTVSWPSTHTDPVLTAVLAQLNLNLISIQEETANRGMVTEHKLTQLVTNRGH